MRLPSQDANAFSESFYGTDLGLPLLLLLLSRSDRLEPYCFFTFLAGTHNCLAGTHNYLAGTHNYFFTFRTLKTTVHHGLPLGGWYCSISFLFSSVLLNTVGYAGSPRSLFWRAWPPSRWLCRNFSSGRPFVWFLIFLFVQMNVPSVFLTLPACSLIWFLSIIFLASQGFLVESEMCGWFLTRETCGVSFFPGVLEVFLCHSVSCMQDFVP